MGSIAILCFSIAISIFQISCEKEAIAQSSSTTQQQGKIIFSKYLITNTIGSSEIWTANYDGSNQTKIPITIPAGMEIEGNIGLSPDGQTLFFAIWDGSKSSLYKCKIDGSGLTKIVSNTSSNVDVEMQVAY